MKPKITSYPIWTNHKPTKKENCNGFLRIKKRGVNGNNWEFECDACGKGLSVMHSDSLPKEYQNDFKKLQS